MASKKATPKVPEARVDEGKKSRVQRDILSQDEVDALLACTADEDQVEKSKSDESVPNWDTNKVAESIKCFICGDDAFRMVLLKMGGGPVPALISYCQQFSVVFGDVESLIIQAYNAGLKSKTS